MTTQSEWVCCCGKELDGSHDHNSCGPPEPRPEPDRPQLTGDLAMLIYRLVRQVRKHEQNNPVANSALDYLQRQGILLDPLRSGGEVIARPVADRLSAALELLLLRYEQCVADNGELWEHQCETAAKDALADYRKAVSP